ncbi:MAG: hypothetical protein ACWGMZ_09285, partial [Thermoguttaceae bacterium]
RKPFGQEANDRRLSVDFDKTPFWRAFDRVLDQAGLTVYAYADRPGLNLVARSADQGLRSKNVFYAGVFRFQPLALVAQRDIDEPKNSSCV